MAETKTTTPQTRNQTPLYIVCIALLVAVVLAIVGFVGKNTANQQNAELTAQLEELTATKADLEEQVTAMTAGLEGKDEEITKLNTLLEKRRSRPRGSGKPAVLRRDAEHGYPGPADRGAGPRQRAWMPRSQRRRRSLPTRRRS